MFSGLEAGTAVGNVHGCDHRRNTQGLLVLAHIQRYGEREKKAHRGRERIVALFSKEIFKN